MHTALDSLNAAMSAHPLLVQALAAVAKTVFMMTVVMLIGGLILSWVERKQSAIMQDRIGANRAAILGVRAWGLFHNLADAAKGILKEDFIPPDANPFLHTLAPFLAVSTAVVAFAVLPFGGTVHLWGQSVDLTIAPLPIGILFVWAMMGMGVYGVVLAGYVSNNKFSLLGCLRATAQVISYEVATGLTVLGALLFYRSLDFRDMVAWQMGHNLGQVPFLGHLPDLGAVLAHIPAWGVFLQPLGFVLFFTATIVEMTRIPFDLPEGESEIIGYNIEYSGMKFMIFMMSEFVESLLFAWVIVLVFFGGWSLPGLHLGDGVAVLFGHALPYASGVALEAAAMALKIVFFLWFQMLVRWSLPRFRYDQIMHLGWKIMLPLALANLAVTGVLGVLAR